MGRELSRAVEDQTQEQPQPGSSLAKRVLVGVLGGIVLVAGIVMIPYPGPGWLVVFAGLAILAKEFTWAERVLQFARRYYDGWLAWLSRQHLAIRALVLAFTAVVVVTTVWLLNVFGTVGGLLGIDWEWLSSPLF